MEATIITAKLVRFLEENDNNPKHWVVKVLNTASMGGIIECGCVFKCDSSEIAMQIRDFLVLKGCKDRTPTLRSMEAVYKYVLLYK